MKPIIHSKKHYVQHSIQTVVAGTPKLLSIALAVDALDVNLPEEVVEGASVKACYIEIWLRSGSTTGSSGQWILFKKLSDTSNPTAIEMAALHDWDNKKNILHTGMGLINDQDADAVPILRGWYKIPKGKQRFGLGDQLKFAIFAPTIDAQICGFMTYKEYT